LVVLGCSPESRPLEEVNEAFDDILHAGNTEPRVVLAV
jgi:hypothetical protein